MKNKKTELTTKGYFLIQISNTTLFRIRTAKKYPSDERNINCSTALYALYNYVETLPMDHPVFHKIESMSEDQMEDFNRMLSRYGFVSDGEGVDPEKFINDYFKFP